MRRIAPFLSAAVALSLLNLSVPAFSQAHVLIPQSSLPQPPSKSGKPFARTQIRILVPSNGQMNFGANAAQPSELPPFAGYFFETPASIACIYGLANSDVKGCNPNSTTVNPSGGSHAIAIVDAFDDPTAESDLATFSSQFGLPAANFQVVYANGSQPALDPTGGWEVEEALDTQWSHAMAPNAKIFLVEAADNSFTNLFNAVQMANGLVAKAGGGEVSMSWGGSEFTFETAFDAYFSTPGVVYLASAGDNPSVIYPSASPYVVSAGGTSISRDANTGEFLLEDTWQDAGGGTSQVEPRPAFQNSVRRSVGNSRGTPDLSFDANPNTGVWVYDSNPVLGTGWYVVGGTSVSAPSLAGIINTAGAFRASSQAENQLIYTNMHRNPSFNDINYGNCGLNIGTFAGPGYDLCTGVGSDRGYQGK